MTIDTVKRAYTGRRTIYTDEKEITKNNVVKVVKNAYDTHIKNRDEINYLYKVYCGDQEILNKQKEVRPEINAKIVLNIAYEIVSFKVGYLLCEPIQYVNKSKEEENTDKITKLNDDMYVQDKESKDQELAEWMAICGVGYRIALPTRKEEDYGTSFKTFTLDPRETFVIRSRSLGNPIIAGVTYVSDENNNITFSVYTKDKYFQLSGNGASLKYDFEKNTYLGLVPIVEYAENKPKIGEFELVLSAINTLNDTESDRADAIKSFVQAIMMIKGVDLDDEDVRRLKDLGAILVPPDGDVKYVTAELNQTQTQTFIDDLYQRILTITGLPVTGDGKTNDSSNNGSTILRNGWYGAETRAKQVETSFSKSEKEFLRIICKILQTVENFDIPLSAIKPKFTRRNYENIVEKSQVLINLLSNDKIYPELAFQVCNLFADAEMAWAKSRDYYQEQVEKELAELAELENAQSEQQQHNHTDIQSNPGVEEQTDV